MADDDATSRVRRPRLLVTLLATVVVAASCSHPIEIVGEGDVTSATGTRGCTRAEQTAGSANCTENLIVGEYDETHTGAAPGRHLHRWVNDCTGAIGDSCSLQVDADLVDDALEQNPDARDFVALPWRPSPSTDTSSGCSDAWHGMYPSFYSIVDNPTAQYPGIDFSSVRCGQAAVELYELYGAGQVPDVDTLTRGSGEVIFTDSLGHADDILVELGRLVWLRAIDGVDLSNYGYTIRTMTRPRRFATASAGAK